MTKKLPSLQSSPEIRRLLKKAVEAIHVCTQAGLVKQKLINALIYHAYPNLPTEEIHRVSLSKISEEIGFDSKNTAFLENELEGLIDITIKWDQLRTGKKSDIWRMSSFLAEAEIKKGVVSYSFPPLLRKAFYNPEIFSIIDLDAMRQFDFVRSTSYRLYENMHRFRNIGNSGLRDVPVWKGLLGVTDEDVTYREFKAFNSKVLKPAIQEVNERSDLTITAEFEKLGRTIVGIRFHIEEKASSSSPHLPAEVDVSIMRQLLDLNISEAQAKSYLARYGDSHLGYILEILSARIKAGKVRNPASLLSHLLKSESINPPIIASSTKKSSSELVIPTLLPQKEGPAVRTTASKTVSAEQSIMESMQAMYDLTPNRERVLLEDEFLDYIKEKNSMAFSMYQKSGLIGSKVVKMLFFEWLRQRKSLA